MKKIFVSLMLLIASLGATGSAWAVVVTGSTYGVYLEGEFSGNPAIPISVFDDTPATFMRDGLVVTVSESDTILSDVTNHISINLSTNGDLFPVFNEGAYLGVGTLDVLDLAFPVNLYDARITMLDLAGNVIFASDNLAGLAVQSQPWDGSLPTPATSLFVSEIGGQDVASITFDFYVTHVMQNSVPEPGSILLCCAGLLAALAMRRRRQSRM
ncbi:PEP-CTERM sorting domain-containing protein [Herbaspirillum sp. SJZ107]|uniref:PEP-CTERM sorting domain-containing protein n=1 Tax=Herbaspirillum sp. SJZ107 TaxID=2572881 RepID=UPI00114ED440|nr:PEP-CTERM sorting domain-containing protein [Herbaspirillum sp. SJZ107]TQK05265.1 putative secreted protein with PEP-CTERM sorting signal/uncharacterized protein (TIGR03382 family) [Herbaspirillum sp. SJZ107]